MIFIIILCVYAGCVCLWKRVLCGMVGKLEWLLDDGRPFLLISCFFLLMMEKYRRPHVLLYVAK